MATITRAGGFFPVVGRILGQTTARTTTLRCLSVSQYPTKPMEGMKVPDVTLKARKDGKWLDIKTGDFFKNKKVVLFSLPGAFTPTCSSTHLPGYESLASDIKAQGVDEIACMSVNDAFVMNAWAKDQKINNVTLLPDGNCEFTEQMGMMCDRKALGFGPRSWRYSMFVNNGVVDKIFSEKASEGDPFEVSDAKTMLEYLKGKKK